ncbi:hypothetical protein [Sanguibacter massiliensis]|uniref:hypothetical protein n=1 Tax=Sanguibacter massiliensis TaxID=1973217 RepID=UPI000C852A44|nr:hypothetical protein [Sanguibacter massiliensis]
MTEADRTRTIEKLLAAALVVIAGAWYPVVGGLTVATVLAVALAPVLLSSLRRFRGASGLFLLWLVAIGAGLLLANLAHPESTVLPNVTRDGAFHLLGVTFGVPVVLWARERWSDPAVGLLFGVGMLATAMTDLSPINPWKFTLSVPVAVVVLSIAWLRRSRRLEIAALLVVAGLCGVNDSRSMFGLVLMTAAIVAGQQWRERSRLRRGRTKRRGSVLGLFLLVAVLGGAAYQLGQALALEGALGTAAAERSARQIEQSGSMLVGSRPEMGATFALVRERPLGFGLGVLPDGTELRAAKIGMSSLGYDPNNGYVERYMFGRGVEVHSVVGDLWAWSGLVGLLLGVVLLVVVGRGLLGRLVDGTASALIVLLSLRVLWDLLFAPFASTMVFLTLLLGLLLVRRETTDPPSEASLRA